QGCLRTRRPSAGRPGPGWPSSTGQDFLGRAAGYVKTLSGAEEATGGDPEGNRHAVGHVADRGAEKAASVDATRHDRRTGRAGPTPRGQPGLPRLPLPNQPSRIRRQDLGAGEKPGRAAAQGAGQEGTPTEELRPPAILMRHPTPHPPWRVLPTLVGI